MLLTAEQQDQIAQTLDAYCDARVPVHVRDKVVLQYRFERNDVLLFEKRPYFRDPSRWIESVVAKFRYTKSDGLWRLLWPDRNTKWHDYEHLDAMQDFQALLSEVDQDPTGIFWG